MDPASAGGLAIGVASLALEVFDGTIKLFKFFSSMLDMPQDYERCRLQLMIEYNRLLAWGDVVGLVGVLDTSRVASSLGTNAIELCSIISRIGRLLDDFKSINNRWDINTDHYQTSDCKMSEEDAKTVDLGKLVSSLAITYESNREIRKCSRRSDRVVAWLSKRTENAKQIVSHPIRARWVLVDRPAFEALLEDLHVLTERIHELMSDYHGKQILEITANTYREMVLVRNDLCELKALFEAITSMMKISTDGSATNASHYGENNETFRDLLLLKKIKCASDDILVKIRENVALDIETTLKDIITVSQYDGLTFNNHFKQNEVKDTNATLDPHRPRGVLSRNGEDHEVWIEWRTIETKNDGSLQDKESILRTVALAQMLSIPKPQQIVSPTCIGYVDNRKGRKQMGWIFEMPQGSHNGSLLSTLHSMLGLADRKPTLTERIALAYKLASSLLLLHAAGWLHKGIHSGNVVFSGDEGKFDVKNPVLSGFEYSRPQSNRTTTRSLDPKWDIYRWPGIQNEVPNAENSRKTHDIYSFGLLLLEIAHWQPLHRLLSLKRWPAPSTQDCRIRGWLLEEECSPPFKNANPLLELRNVAGDKYWKATRFCLIAQAGKDSRKGEELDQTQGSAIEVELQTAFAELVVEGLKTVSL